MDEPGRQQDSGEPTLAARIAGAVAAERRAAGLSLSELARRAGLAKSTLSQLEAGLATPGVETLWAISTALAIPLSRVIDPAPPIVEHVPVDAGIRTYAAESDYAAVLLTSFADNIRTDLYRIHAEPGPPRRSAPHQLGVVEHVILTAGRASAGPLDDPVEMAQGDYLRYPGDRPHLFRALEPGTVAVMVMEYR